MHKRSGPFWDSVEGRAPVPQAAATLGLEFIDADVEKGTIELAFAPTEAFTNPTGNVLGGFQAAMLFDTKLCQFSYKAELSGRSRNEAGVSNRVSRGIPDLTTAVQPRANAFGCGRQSPPVSHDGHLLNSTNRIVPEGLRTVN